MPVYDESVFLCLYFLVPCLCDIDMYSGLGRLVLIDLLLDCFHPITSCSGQRKPFFSFTVWFVPHPLCAASVLAHSELKRFSLRPAKSGKTKKWQTSHSETTADRQLRQKVSGVRKNQWQSDGRKARPQHQIF